MSKTYAKYSFLITAFLITFINLCISAPFNVNENIYTEFITELNRNGCSVPRQVQLPFDTNKANDFGYLSPYLEICQQTESTKQNKETFVLCEEIFNNIKNISCSTKTALPDINLKLSKSVCLDINALKDSVPEDDKSLLKRLTDRFLCDIMCDGEFEKACQVLLWSFEVQKLIASVGSSQEPEHPSVLEDGENVDGKQNAEAVKGANEISEIDSITETSELHNTEDNPEQNSDKIANHVKSQKQEKSAPAGETVLKNQTIPVVESQNLTEAPKSSISSLKTSSTLSTQATASYLITKSKPIQELTKAETNDQNISKQLQGDDNINLDKVDTGDSLQNSENNGGSDRQTQFVSNDFLDGKQVKDTKDNKVLSNKHLQDNSNTPVNGENENDITDEMPEKQNQNSNLLLNKEHHVSEIQKTVDVATTDLLNKGQKPSSNVNEDQLQNKLQNAISNDENLADITNTSRTDSQAIKKTTNHQTIGETTLDKISVTRDEIRKDQTKTDAITHGLVTSDGVKNALTDQKQTKVDQQPEEFDNTIPDATGISDIAKEEETEKSPKSKPIAAIPDAKNVLPSSRIETSTKTTVALEKMESRNDFHQPADEEAAHYGDVENTEDDYSRPDYDGNLYDGSKTKESNADIPSPITVAKEVITNQNEKPIDFASKNSFGQDLNDIQMMGFPEQEDSHFFFYFLSIVLILMAGYLIFHNKQKIIALIVEGRHERNRRSHRIGYKKLETK